MTLSESQAMEDFDFLGSDDNMLLARFSRASFSDIPEGMLFGAHVCMAAARLHLLFPTIYRSWLTK